MSSLRVSRFSNTACAAIIALGCSDGNERSTPTAPVGAFPASEPNGSSPSSMPASASPGPDVESSGGGASSQPVTMGGEVPATPVGISVGESAPPGGISASGGSAPAQAAAEGMGPSAAGAAPNPSAQCGRTSGQPVLNLSNTIVTVPASYDGTKPVPVVIAFHAAGNPNTQLRNILGPTLQDDYLMIYPKSDGNGWSNGADASKVDAAFAALDASACYDQNRVFATGHSSGAQFIVQRLCAGESRFRAVAPVASSVYCASWKPIPALVIHGIGDTERQAYGLNDGEGLKDIVPYRTSNSCQETSTPLDVAGCNSQGTAVDPGCRSFNGCTEPTIWCQHNDPQYGTSHHGVPCFGARMIKSFFDGFQ